MCTRGCAPVSAAAGTAGQSDRHASSDIRLVVAKAVRLSDAA
jgi:hypothetical protein